MYYRRSSLLISMFLLIAGVASLALMSQAQAADGLELHGWVANRFYGEPGSAHFQAERISLYVSKDIDENLKAYIEYYYHNWANLKTDKGSPWMLESAYVNFTDKKGNQLRIGKGRVFCFGLVPTYGNRKHSEYGLVAETFTQERSVGLQYFGSTADKKLDFGIALLNALPPSTRFSGTDQAFFRDEPVVSHLADKGDGKNLAGSARIAVPVMAGGKLGLSYRTGKLTKADLTFLGSKDLLDRGAHSDTNNQWGADFNYKHKSGVVAQAEYYGAKMSSLDFNGWDALLGYEPADPMGVKYYARYGKLDLDPPAVTSSSYTWDQTQWIVSLVKPLRKGKPVWLQVEWISNDETPPSGTSKVDNDVFFVELFTGF